MKHRFLTLLLALVCSCIAYPADVVDRNLIDLDLQLLYDFGSEGTACHNQRSHRMTLTTEFFCPDKWGSTYCFFDMDFSLNPVKEAAHDPKNMPFGAYIEISRSLNFWKNTPARDLSFHAEYNGGLGIYGGEVVAGGYGVYHTILLGPEYFLHTPDYKNTFTLELLFRYQMDEPNLYRYYVDGAWQRHAGNLVPLQFTFVWGCKDFCKVKGLTFCGYIDVWGIKQSVLDGRTGEYTDPNRQSFVIGSEPQLWYSIGQWFHCPNLLIGGEVEFTYNFTGVGFMCNPCLGLRWNFL